MNLDDTLVAASRAAPSLDPSMLYGVVQNSTDPGSALDNAQATEAFGTNVKMSGIFDSSDPWVRDLILRHMTPEQYNMLTSTADPNAGPQKQAHHSSLFGDAVNAVGSALGVAEHAIGTGVSDSLHALASPLRLTQHLLRTASWMDTGMGQKQWSPFSNEGLSRILSPQDWADAWNTTEHGEQTFDPGIERQLRQQYGDDRINTARLLASGQDIQAYSRNLPSEQSRLDFQDKLADPQVQTAARQLNAAKFSFGRQIVNSLGLKPTGNAALPSFLPIIGHQDLQSLLSGSVDAVLDLGIDPTLAGGKALQGYRAAKFLVAGDDAVNSVERLLQTNTAVQRLVTDQAGFLADGNVAGLIDKYPKFSDVAGEWAKRGITSTDDLGQWYVDQAKTGALMAGKAGGWSGAGYLMPHLTATQQVALNAKGAFKSVIDWAADHAGQSDAIKSMLPDAEGLATPVGTPAFTVSSTLAPSEAARNVSQAVFQPMGKIARQLTNLVPVGTTFDPNAPEALTNIQRIARMGLPETETNRILNAFASSATEGGKKQIYQGLVLDTMKAMGVDSTQAGREYMNHWADMFDKGLTDRSFAPGQIDQLPIGSKNVASGILKKDASDEWALPDFKTMWANSNRSAFSRTVFGMANSEIATKFMQSAWKPLTLLRLGFPIRAGGEEAVNDMLRQGPIGFLRSRAAMSAGAEDWGAGQGGVLDSLTQHLPGRDQIQTAKDLASNLWTDTYGKAMGKVQGAIAGEKMMAYNGELHEMFSDALPDQLSAAKGIAGYAGNEQTATQMMRNGEKMKLAYEPTGGFRDYQPTEFGAASAWKVSLDRLTGDDWGKQALQVIDQPREVAVNHIADALQSDSTWNRMTRSRVLRDGSQVGTDTTERAAAMDHANVLLDYAHSITENPDGTRVIDPQSLLDAGRGPSINDLSKIAVDRRPSLINGPEVLPVPQSGWRSFLDSGFDRIVGKPMNWIARQPIFQHNYALARDYFEQMRPGLESLATPSTEEEATQVAENVQRQIQELSSQRALNATIPFIHDPELKSQFSVYTRNLMPFWFAQEQFVKRWANTFVHSPEAFREAQLTMDGLRHSGVVHKDSFGSEVFTYPGVNLTADALAAVMNVTGHKVAMPPPITFSGEVKFATPGTERLGIPSFGPLVSVPLTALTNMFPELSKGEQQILGQRGVGKGYLEQVVPTTATRLAKVFMANPDTDAQLASAQRQAIQIFAAHHQIPDENASPTDRQQFLDKVKGLSRVIAMTRVLYGFSAPAAPELQMDPDHLNEDFRKLLGSGLNVHDAVNQFVKQNPGIDVTPYTVFQSKSETGAPVPSTAATLAQFAGNGSYYRDYPLAAAWLLPQNSTDKTFNQTAYRESLALGLRKMKAPSEMLNDIYYAQASPDYFSMLTQKNDAVNQLKNQRGTAATNGRAAITQAWQSWQQSFFDTHPIFADQYQSANGHLTRQNAIDQLHQALADPRAPDVTHGPALATLLGTYDELKDSLGLLRGTRTQAGTQLRQSMVQEFSRWAESYVSDNPDLQGVYDRIFRPEVSTT